MKLKGIAKTIKNNFHFGAQSENKYLQILFKTSAIKNLDDSLKQNILDCISKPKESDTTEHSPLYQLINTIIGDNGIDILNENLEEKYGEDFSLATLVNEIYKFVPKNNFLKDLYEDDIFFKDKFLFLETEKVWDTYEILNFQKQGNHFQFNLKNKTRFAVLHLSYHNNNISNICLIENSQYNFFDYLLLNKYGKYDGSQKEITVALLQEENIDKSIEPGCYILSQLNKREKTGYLTNEHSKSFLLSHKTGKRNYTIVIRDEGDPEKIKNIEIFLETSIKKKKKLKQLKHCNLNNFKILIDIKKEFDDINLKNINDKLKIKEKFKNKSEWQIEKLQEIRTFKDEIVIALENNNHYWNKLLDNFMQNKLLNIDDYLINDISNNVTKIKDALKNISNIYAEMRQLEINISQQSENDILIEAVLEVNYKKLVPKKDSTVISRAMDLLNNVFDHIHSMKDKDLVLFFGNTGAGKSTMINYYLGLQLEQSKGKYGQPIVELKSLQELGSNFYIFDSLPNQEKIKNYKYAFIFLKNKKELYYVHSNHFCQLIALEDKVQFSDILASIMKDCEHKYLSYNQIEKLIVSKNSCDIHLIPTLPFYLAPYKNSYILINNKELVYIKGNNKAEKVKINNFDSFLILFNAINKNKISKINLSPQNIKELITSNGGHIPKGIDLRQIITIEPERYAKIGESLVTSETTYVHGYELIAPVAKVNELMLGDCPGSKDTRGIDHEIATAISIDQTIQSARSIKAIVLTIPVGYFFSDKMASIHELFANLQAMLPQLFSKPEIKKSIFLLITKPNKEQSLEIIKKLINDSIKKLIEDTVSKKDTDLDITEKENPQILVLKMINDLMEEERVDLVENIEDPGNKIARSEIVKKFFNSPALLRENFAKTIDREGMMVKNHFAKYIGVSIDTWQHLIIEPYLSYPQIIEASQKEIIKYQNKISKKEQKIQEIIQELIILNDSIPTYNNEKLQYEQLKIKGNFSSNDLLVKKLNKAMVAFKKDLVQAKKIELNKLLTELSLGKNDFKNQESKINKQSDSIETIETEIEAIEKKIYKLSTGSCTINLWKTQYFPRQKLNVMGLNDNADRIAFEEIRDFNKNDFNNKVYYRGRADQYQGTLLEHACIEKDYYILPKDPSKLNEFIQSGADLERKYKAEVTGNQFEYYHGIKATDSGKKIIYSFKTIWNADGIIPYISITHTLPNKDINEAEIINLEGNKNIKLKKLNQLNQNLKQLRLDYFETSTDIKKLNKNIEDLKIEIANLEKEAIIFGIDEHISQLDQSIKDTKIVVENKESLVKEQNRKIYNYIEKIKEQKTIIKGLYLIKLRYATIIKQQGKTAELLYKFAELAIGNDLGINRQCGLFNHENVFKLCEEYIKFYANNKNTLQTSVEQDFTEVISMFTSLHSSNLFDLLPLEAANNNQNDFWQIFDKVLQNHLPINALEIENFPYINECMNFTRENNTTIWHLLAKSSAGGESHCLEILKTLILYVQDKSILIKGEKISEDTPLHLAIKNNRYDIMLFFIMEGCADITIKNKDGKTVLDLIHLLPSSTSKNELLSLILAYNKENIVANESILELRTKCIANNKSFIDPIEKTLANSIDSGKLGNDFNKKAHRNVFDNLNAIIELRPLLQIMHFGVLGYHDIKTNNNPKLCIVVDPDQANTNEITLGNVNNAYGVYYNRKNTIYVAGKRSNENFTSRKLVLGTLIHEVAHFVSNEVFKNDCNPYLKTDKINKKYFESICNELHEEYTKGKDLCSELKSVFACYPSSQWHVELIVRIPQLIAQDKLNIAIQQCPNLLTYYKIVFLPACQRHIFELRHKHQIFPLNFLKTKYITKEDRQVVLSVEEATVENFSLVPTENVLLSRSSKKHNRTPTNSLSSELEQENFDIIQEQSASTSQNFEKIITASSTNESNFEFNLIGNFSKPFTTLPAEPVNEEQNDENIIVTNNNSNY